MSVLKFTMKLQFLLLLPLVNGIPYRVGDLPNRLIDQGGFGPPEVDTSNGGSNAGDGSPIIINGNTFEHGIGTHATSVISYDLEGKCSTFSSWIGIDDEIQAGGSVLYLIYTDGTLAYQSDVMTASNGAVYIDSIPLHGVTELMLIVDDAGDFYHSDRADWAEPIVECSSQPNGDGATLRNVRGSWGPELSWPVKAIHAALLPSGHIISHASQSPTTVGSDNPEAPHDMTKVDLSDIETWSHEWVNHLKEELYCSAHTLLRDGSLFEFGGHGGADANFLYYGQDQASRFDFETKSWIEEEDMQQARWYASGVTLGNGDVMSIGGSHAGGNTFLPEIFDGTNWRMLWNVDYANRLHNNDFIFDHTYPFVHLASDGRVLWAGWDENMAYIDVQGDGSWSPNYFREDIQRAWGAPVLYRVDNLLIIGGIDHAGTYGPATRTAVHVDMNVGGDPIVTQATPMLFPRADADGTVLPNGKVFVNGGGYVHILGSHPSHIYVPETWDPDTDTWTIGAAATNPRGYHSTSLLLPDGRVWTGGGECGDTCVKGQTAQIYSPPYLFNGDGSLATRPQILSISSGSTIIYGETFNVSILSGIEIQKVTIVRLGSTTHHINFEQRYLELQFTVDDSTLGVTAPEHGNIAPPGYYMLFVLDELGVPSVAEMVRFDTKDLCNLLDNGSFDDNINGWWGGSTTMKSGDGYQSSGALSVAQGASGTLVSVSNAGGVIFTLSGFYKTADSTTQWKGVGLDFLSSDFTEIGDAFLQLTNAGSYTPFEVSGNAPVGTTEIQVWVYTGSSTAILLDDLSLQRPDCSSPGCRNWLTNGDFDTLTGWWLGNGSGTVSNDGYDGNALAISNGVSYITVPLGSTKSHTLSGQYKASGGAWKGLGMDFLNTQGVKIGNSWTGLENPDSYTAFELTGVPPTGTTQVGIWIYNSGSDPMLVDSLRLHETNCRNCNNLVTNGNVEGNLDGWWQGNGSVARANEGYQSSHSISISNGWTDYVVSGGIQGGMEYVLSGYYKTATADNAWKGLGMDFLNTSGNELGEAGAGLASSNDWAPFSVRGVAPTGTTQISIWIYQGGSSTIFIDAVDLRQANCS